MTDSAFKEIIISQVIDHLAGLRNAAQEVQQKYQRELLAAAKKHNCIAKGYFPRVKQHQGGIYIYWEKYQMGGGSTRLKSRQGQTSIRISSMVKIRKKGEAYPMRAFNPSRVPPWELELIMDAERELSQIRVAASTWMRVLKQVRASK